MRLFSDIMHVEVLSLCYDSVSSRLLTSELISVLQSVVRVCVCQSDYIISWLVPLTTCITILILLTSKIFQQFS